MTRQIISYVWSVAVILTAAQGWAADPPSANEILDKAIKAVGGAKKIAEAKSMTFTDTGKYYGMGDGVDYTANTSAVWPTRAKFEIEGAFTICSDGDKGWVRSPMGIVELNEEQLAEQKAELRASWIATSFPRDDKSLTFTATGESKVNDRPVLNVKVTQKGQRDITLSFDKETGLLAKMTTIVKSREHENREVTQEALDSDYKDVDGYKMPTKFVITRDGKKFVEGERSKIKIGVKLDDSVFARPKE